MKRLLLLVLPALFACNEKTYYMAGETAPDPLSSGRRTEPIVRAGKCYSNCLIPDQYASKLMSFPIYTGSDASAPRITKSILVEPAKTKWIKKEEGFYCLTEIPAVKKDIQILADTVRYKDYQFELFEYKELTEKGGFSREVEVVCPDHRSTNLFLQLSAALKAQGYLQTPTAQPTKEFSQALRTFQKDNSLPLGDLDYETLGFLGIANW